MRLVVVLLVILALGLTAYMVPNLIPERRETGRDSAPEGLSAKELRGGRNSPVPAGQIPEPLRTDRESVLPHQSVPVALNRSAQVLDGFRGDVHPLLHGRTKLEVTAQWTPVGKGRDQLHRSVNPIVYAWFTGLAPAQQRQTYTERDFSAFLPVAVGVVGQLWALDGDKVAGFLKQFHPRPSMHLVAPGRRAGPDGAFAILRAASPSYLDIWFRIHAEFYLTPPEWPAGLPAMDAWYSPAYFAGRVLVNRRTGTVDHFQLGLATEKALNVHLTVDASRLGYTRQAHDIVRVERMELTGGDGGLVEKVPWKTLLTPAEANRRLAKVFYKSMEIDWIPFDQALAQARSRHRPIFALVSWGATDDQSC
jgi:hypothetical protein